MTLVALCQFGIALAAPIGLRMDRHGLSGFYLAPLAWRDVQNMTLYTRDAHSRVDASYDLDAPPSPADMFLALRLWDHEKWWQTNTTMQRILFLLRGRAKGWDALISIGTLALTDRHALADAACDLHDRRPPAI